MSRAAAAQHRGDGHAAAGLSLATLVLYLATLSQQPSGDSAVNLRAVESSNWADRVDAYHLLLQPLCRVWVEMGRACGWTGSTMTALQVLNAIGGAVSVGIVFVVVAWLTTSRVSALLAAVGLAVSGGMWMFATEAEGVALPLPVHLLLLLVLLRLPAGEPRQPMRAFALGLCIGAGALLYLTFAMLLAVALLAQNQGREKRWRAQASTLVGFSAVVAPAAAFVAWLQTGGTWRWRRLLAHYVGADVYGAPRWDSLPRGVYAFLRTLVLYPGLGINDRTSSFLSGASALEQVVWGATYSAVAVVAVITLVLAWRHRRTWPDALRQRLVLWAALYTVFAFYWVPSDLEFWIPVTVAWFILAGLLIAQGSISPRVAMAAVAAMLIANAANLILPHHLYGYRKSAFISAISGPSFQPLPCATTPAWNTADLATPVCAFRASASERWFWDAGATPTTPTASASCTVPSTRA